MGIFGSLWTILVRHATGCARLAACGLLSVGAFHAALAQRPLDGLWIGGHLSDEGYLYVRMTVTGDSAVIDLPFQLRNGQRARVAQSGDGATFEFRQRAGLAQAVTQLRGDTLAGVVRIGSGERDLRLTRMLPLPDDSVARLSGIYENADGQLVTIGPTELGTLTYMNFATGENRSLFLTRSGFVAGPGLFIPHPPVWRLTSRGSAGGNAAEIRVRRGNAVEVAKRVHFGREELRWTSGGVAISGSLIKPLGGKPPYPVVVFIHGSGPTTRESFFGLPYYFAMHSVASLVYDKRGVGQSGGAYVHNVDSARFELLAGDAIAGINAIRGRADIDTTRIGVWGISQAGWIVPIVAARSPDVDFTIIVSGPVATLGEEGYFSTLMGDDGDGPRLARAEVAERMRTYRPSGFDPVPYLRQQRAPGLWIFGGEDNSVPVDVSMSNLKVLQKEGKPFEIEYFPKGQHVLWETDDGSRQQLPL
ncbi:MAG TPA: prolyl oligopeptidase family serine peptidase, partial [Gemmatimonadaceae bacterium]|nr:prolyl oligopeptidase family serine peptidase [Gemmatimonadaceae bacterium]